MNYQERKRLILSFLEDVPSQSVHDLAGKLGVSEITVRRDLNIMATKGLVVRTHGGVMHNKYADDPTFFANKGVSNLAQKQKIAERASSLIGDGDIVFMDCGTTVHCMAQFVRTKNIAVITNSLPLASALLGTKVKVNLIGGEVDHARQAVHGFIAAEHISRYRGTKAFIGVDGLTAEGLFAHSEAEASISLAYMNRAREVILLCDSSKINKTTYLNFASVDSINTLVTDDGVPKGLVNTLTNAGIGVLK